LTTEYHFGAGDLVNGSVNLVLTSTNNGSCVEEDDTLTITFGTTAFASAGNDFSMCNSGMNTGPLNGAVSGGASTGEWSTLGSGTFTPNNTDLNAVYNPSVTDLASGSFELVLTTTNNGSCAPGRDTVMVTVEPDPIANAGVNIQVCETTDTVQLAGSVTNVTMGQWSTSGTGSFFPNNTDLNPMYIPSNADQLNGLTTIYLSTTDAQICLNAVDSITIEYADPLAINFGNTPGCVNSFINFTDSTTINFGTIAQWSWTFGDGGSSQSPNPVYAYSAPGAYDVTLTVVSSLGCEYSLIQTVLVQSPPSASFNLSSDTVIVGENVSYTDLSSGAASWFWTFGDGLGTAIDQNPTYSYSEAGNFEVLLQITNSLGCTDTTTNNIVVLSEEEPYFPPVIPTGFSPNGDGENDVLFVRGGPFESVILRVYNNWGNLIFESNDVNVGWDGTHKGKDQPKGDYVYSAIVIGLDGTEYVKKGSISIIR